MGFIGFGVWGVAHLNYFEEPLESIDIFVEDL